MYHQTLVIVAFLPAFFLGWKLPAIVGLLGCSMSEPLGSTKGRILLLRELDGVRTYLLEGKSEFFYRCPAFAMSA